MEIEIRTELWQLTDVNASRLSGSQLRKYTSFFRVDGKHGNVEQGAAVQREVQRHNHPDHMLWVAARLRGHSDHTFVAFLKWRTNLDNSKQLHTGRWQQRGASIQCMCK